MQSIAILNIFPTLHADCLVLRVADKLNVLFNGCCKCRFLNQAFLICYRFHSIFYKQDFINDFMMNVQTSGEEKFYRQFNLQTSASNI
jgi:hypothetical protein